MRKRVRCLLGGDGSSRAGSDVDIDVALTLGAGALMLARMDPEPLELSSSFSNGDAVGSLRNGDGGKPEDGRGQGVCGEERGSGVLDGREHFPEAASVVKGPPPPAEEPGREPLRTPQGQHQQQGGGALLEGGEASLLMGYLGAVASTAAAREQATAEAPAVAVAAVGTARTSFRNGPGVSTTEIKVRLAAPRWGGYAG